MTRIGREGPKLVYLDEKTTVEEEEDRGRTFSRFSNANGDDAED